MALPKYRYVLIETYRARAEQSVHRIRSRVLPRQGLPRGLRVECSARMRESHPPGTVFKVWARIKTTDMQPHMYTSWQWPYDVLDDSGDIEDFVQNKRWRERDAPAWFSTSSGA